MDSNLDYSDCEELISVTEDAYSSSESESDDDTLNAAIIGNNTSASPNFEFTSTSGIISLTKFLLENKDDLMMFFNIFFDEKIVSVIMKETNRHGEKFFNNSSLAPSSRAS